MGLLERFSGVPKNSSISEEFDKVFSPKVSDDYRESYEAANNPSEEKSSESSLDYYNCSTCGGMGRTGGEKSYSTIGGSCTNCNGTGHID